MDDWDKRFLKEIVELDTNSEEKKNYTECADVITRYCEEAGLKVEIFDSKHDDIPQPNVVATLDVGAKETVLLCMHYDVVPAGDAEGWTRPPFKLTDEGEKLYGRGVTDNKGNIVAAVSAAKELAKKGTSKINLKLLLSPNEEIGGVYGIDYLINGPPKVRGEFGIVVDSGPEYVSIGASGVLAGKITVHGQQGHAGYPFAFANAIHLSIPLLDCMLDYVDVRRKVTSEYPAPPGSPYENLWGRFSMTVYKAGSKSNVIPGTADITFDCRLIPEEDPEDIAKDIESFLEKAKEETGVDASLEITMKVHGWGSDKEDKFIQALHAAVKEVVDPDLPISADLGGNDGHFFTSVGIPTACYGTIATDGSFHGLDEWLAVKDFDSVRAALVCFAEKCD
ncbi:MAG: ArgE/DapE family deacylase [Candidatus Thorarchaeota archaeon]|nr:MAG: ArgE/DapE family deacylase [Candidatus Thorarchaeota archaeon]